MDKREILDRMIKYNGRGEGVIRYTLYTDYVFQGRECLLFYDELLYEGLLVLCDGKGTFHKGSLRGLDKFFDNAEIFYYWDIHDYEEVKSNLRKVGKHISKESRKTYRGIVQ